MLLTDFFNSQILNTLLKLLALTSECCCQATFPTKKTKKKISWSRVDYDFALGSGRKCLWENENLCENIQWTKVISRRRKLLNADLLLNNVVKWKHTEIFSRASRTEGGRYTTSYNISSIDNFYEMESWLIVPLFYFSSFGVSVRYTGSSINDSTFWLLCWERNTYKMLVVNWFYENYSNLFIIINKSSRNVPGRHANTIN